MQLGALAEDPQQQGPPEPTNEGRSFWRLATDTLIDFLRKHQMLPPSVRMGPARSTVFPAVVHMKGFSLLIVLFYAHPTLGFARANAQRYARLGALLQSVQLPWIVLGDFNQDVSEFRQSAFVKRVHGHIRQANVDYTCVGGAGSSHIDFLMASESGLP